MENKEQVLARARAYELFAELFTFGITTSNLSLVKLIPGLYSTIDESGISAQVDNWESDHYDIFGKNVFPYESIYLDVDMNLGGEKAERISDFYQQIGFDPPTSENADHIGIELSCLAFLCRQELEQDRDTEANVTQSVHDFQRKLIKGHILQWLPMLQHALSSQANVFYDSICDMTMGTIIDHYLDLTSSEVDITVNDSDMNILMLADKKTGLKDIVLHLLTPAYSGAFISQSEISRIAKELDLPRGFGNRVQTLMNLIRAAISFDRVPQLLDEIRSILNLWIDFYSDLSNQYDILKSVSQHNSDKVVKCLQIILQVKDAAQLEAAE